MAFRLLCGDPSTCLPCNVMPLRAFCKAQCRDQADVSRSSVMIKSIGILGSCENQYCHGCNLWGWPCVILELWDYLTEVGHCNPKS